MTQENIKHKFKTGQKVYFLLNNKIRLGQITQFYIIDFNKGNEQLIKVKNLEYLNKNGQSAFYYVRISNIFNIDVDLKMLKALYTGLGR